MRRLLNLLLFSTGLTGFGIAHANYAPQTLTIAAAANLADVIEVLDDAFVAQTPGAGLKVSTGSSGNFYAQIKNGAPFDVFVSADVDFPRKLAAEGSAQSNSLVIYALGRLALWSTNPAVDLSRGLLALNTADVKKLAIANPDTAPYGRAAKATLQSTGLWDAMQKKLVTGENIAQAAQFVQTGNADAGFVAYSTLRSPKLAGVGTFWLVPAEVHAPLEQAAVITLHGKDNPLAARYLAFLKSATAQSIFRQWGYDLPAAAAH